MDRPGVEFKHPTDRGWAWVIVFAAAVANFVVNGGVRTMGLLIVELSEFYKAGETTTMVVTACLAAGFAIFSCLGNILGMRFTMRKVAVAGACFAFFGMLLTAMSPSISIVIMTLGMMSGIGYGFLFGPSMVLVGQYCPKRMSIANGLAVAGGSIGQLVLPFFIVGVMRTYQFRGGILLYAGIILHSIPAMLLLRPPSFYGIKKPRPQIPVEDINETAENNNITTAGDTQLSISGSHPTPYPYPASNPSYFLRDGTLQQEMPLDGYRSANSPFFHPPMNYRRPSGIDGQDLYRIDPEFYRRASMAVPHTREEVAQELNVPQEAVTTKVTAKLFFRRCCDPVLLKNPVFITYVIGLSLGHSGFIGACTCVAPYVSFLFGSKSAGAVVIFVMGIGDLLGRCGGGIVAQMGWFRKSSLVGGSFVISGALAVLLPFFGRSMIAVIGFGGLFGLLGGTYMAQLVAMADDLFGSALLASSLGLSTMIMGLFAIPIIPTLGRLASRPPPMLPNYGISVRWAGLIAVLGGILFYIIPLVSRYRKRKLAKAQGNTETQGKSQDQNIGQSQNQGQGPVLGQSQGLDGRTSNGALERPGTASNIQPTSTSYQQQAQYIGVQGYPVNKAFGPNQPQNASGYPASGGYYQPAQQRDGYFMQPQGPSGSMQPYPLSRQDEGPQPSSRDTSPPGSLPRGPYPGPVNMNQYTQQRDANRWSQQDFRWSKIPNSPESNL